MFEVHNISELKNIFLAPVLFYLSRGKSKSIAVEFFDYGEGTKYAAALTLSQWHDQEFEEMSFSSLRGMIEAGSASSLDSLIETVVHQSNLYRDSMHHCKMTFTNSDGDSTTLQRFFVIPAINASEAESKTSLIELSIQDTGCLASFLVDEPQTISFETYIVLRCRYSDIILFNNTVTEQTNLFQTKKDVSNYDMSEIMAFLIVRNLDGARQLVTHRTLSQTLILSPRYTLNQRPAVYDAASKTKRIGMMLHIESIVNDGLRMKDYGSYFYRNGLRISAKGADAHIFVNRLIGYMPDASNK